MAKISSKLLTMFVLTAVVCSPALAASILPGDILISNHGGDNVQLLDPTTSSVSTLVTVPGTPIGLAFDSTGNLYINVTNGIEMYNPVTNTLNTTFFTGSGQREGLTYDPVTNHLFSVSFGGNHIEEVDLAGNLVRNITIPGTGALLGISARGGNLAVTDFDTGDIFVGTTTGSTFKQIGTATAGNTYAADFDSSGNVYVNDFATGQTVRFANLGGGNYGPKTTFISGLSNPDNGLSIGDDGSLTISEFGADAISVWNSDGTLRKRYFGIADPDELVVDAPIRSSGGGTPVPEPSTILLLSTGLVALGSLQRRRNRKQNETNSPMR